MNSDSEDTRAATTAPPAVPFSALLRLSVPRQHGAWAILAAAVVLGLACEGRPGPASAWLCGAVLAGFLARHAALLAMRMSRTDPRRGRLAGLAAAEAAACAALGLATMVGGQLWALLPLGLAAAVVAAASTGLESRGKGLHLGLEILGVLGLCLVTPALHYAVTGEFGSRTWALWALSCLFFAGRPLQVRYLARHRTGARTLPERLATGWPTLAYHLAALAGAGALAAVGEPALLPPLGPVTLLPAALAACWKVAFPRETPVGIAGIGLREAAHVVLFVALTVLAFRW
jgi:hypothetical protein